MSLSDKITEDKIFIPVYDVKEFIRELKEAVEDVLPHIIWIENVHREIDKLAGEDLLEEAKE